MTEKHSPLPWAEDCDGNIRDANGHEVDWIRGLPIALEHVNGTDARTVALVEALTEARDCLGRFDRFDFDATKEKIRAALALARKA